MALPRTSNTTCDIYRSGSAPPAAPSVAGVAICLEAAFDQRIEAGEAGANDFRYSHVALIDLSVDVRDANYGSTPMTGLDSIYVPDQNGTRFLVRFVARSSYESTAYKRVYLDRKQPTWPTNDL